MSVPNHEFAIFNYVHYTSCHIEGFIELKDFITLFAVSYH